MENIRENFFNDFKSLKERYHNAKNYSDYPTVAEADQLFEDIQNQIYRLDELLDELQPIITNLYSL